MHSKRFSKNILAGLEDLMRHGLICVQATEDLFSAFVSKDQVLASKSSVRISHAYLSCANLKRVLINTLISGSDLPVNSRHIIDTVKLIEQLAYNCENLNKTIIYVNDEPPKEIHVPILIYFSSVSEVLYELSEIFINLEDFFAKMPSFRDEDDLPYTIKKCDFSIENESWIDSYDEVEDEFQDFYDELENEFQDFNNENTNETEYIYNENENENLIIEEKEEEEKEEDQVLADNQIIEQDCKMFYDPLVLSENEILFGKLKKIDNLRINVRKLRILINKGLFKYSDPNALLIWNSLSDKMDKVVNGVDELVESIKIMLFLCEM